MPKVKVTLDNYMFNKRYKLSYGIVSDFMCICLGKFTALKDFKGIFNNNIIIIVTRLPSNLRPTNCKCMHLVRCGHTIGSAIAENPKLHANFMTLCFIELELLLIEVFHLSLIHI